MGNQGEAEAIWQTHIPEAGRYEVMALVHNHQSNVYRQVDGEMGKEERKPLVYHYILMYSGEQEKIEIEVEAGTRWVSLGEYDFPAGETRLILNDRGEPYHFIIADAVKWVRVE